MSIQITPKGVCAKQMQVEVVDGIVESLQVVGGCPGNLLGLSALVKGLPVEDVVAKLEGITCGGKSTSCPDQLAKNLKEYISA